MNLIFFKKNTKRGFTLVESLIAIFIFTVSVSTMLVILSSSVSEIDYVKRRVVANYLAQEGLEYVRNLRDTHILYTLTGTGWPDFVAKMQPCNTDFSSDGCYYDSSDLFTYGGDQPIINTPIIACSGACPTLRYNKNNLSYDYNPTGEDTSYQRIVRISILPGQEEMYVYSQVKWQIKGQSFEVTFQENLFNWPLQ